MSKHHAVEGDPQSSDMSWIRGLARPADHSTTWQPEASSPYYDSLVSRAPRHAAPVDDSDGAGQGATAATDLRGDVPAAVQTGPLGRISAEQIDSLIGRLDAVDPVAETPDPAVETPDPAVETPDPVTGNHADQESAAEPAAVGGSSDVIGPATGERESDESEDVGLDIFGLSVDDTPVDNTPVAEAAPAQDVPLPGAGVSQTTSTRLRIPRRGRLQKPILLGAAAALCLLTVGGGAMAGGALAGGNVSLNATGSATAKTSERTVAIVVDGRTEKVTTFSNSVAGALAAAGITPNRHDALAPGAGASIANGSMIVLNRGRLLSLTIDGQQRQIWTTARTVADALAQLGVSTSDWSLSASRSRAIPLTGLSISGSTLHTVSMSLAGRALQSSTTAAKTVGELLAQQEIMLSPLDRVSPGQGTKLSDGLVVTVERVVLTTTTTAVALPQPASQTVPDATIATGTSKITQQGRPGSDLITYTVILLDGRQSASFEQGRSTTVAPVGTITHVGTGPHFTYVGSQVLTNDTSFGVNWDGLAMCESTHNPKAINANPVAGLPTYGMFQFDLPTWASVGGSGNPIDATPQEQLMRAKLLFQQRGLEPWACRDAAH